MSVGSRRLHLPCVWGEARSSKEACALVWSVFNWFRLTA